MVRNMKGVAMRGMGLAVVFLAFAGAGRPAWAQCRSLVNNPPPGRTFLLSTGGELFIPDAFSLANGKADLLVHFHGAPFVVKQNLAEAKWNAVIVNYTVNGFSSAYSTPFSNQTLFQRMIDEALAKLRTALASPAADWNRVVLSSFSAGYGAIREILKNPAYVDRVSAVCLADSIHAGFDAQGKPNAATLAPFTAWAKLAAEGKKILWSTHTAILTYTYANTTECNDALIAAAGATRLPASGMNAWCEVLKSAADKGTFHVRGYAGTAATDHMRQLWNQAEFYGKCAAELGAVPSTGSTGGGGTTTTGTLFAMKVTASSLNVRSGPGTGYSIIGGISNGQIYVSDASSNGGSTGLTAGWRRIWYKGNQGWCSGTYLAQVTGVTAVRVTATSTAVRTGPGSTYAQAGTAYFGHHHAQVSTTTGWVKVWWGGGAYWVASGSVSAIAL